MDIWYVSIQLKELTNCILFLFQIRGIPTADDALQGHMILYRGSIGDMGEDGKTKVEVCKSTFHLNLKNGKGPKIHGNIKIHGD